MIAKEIEPKFAFSIIPEESDWSWIPNAPNISLNTDGSQLMIGDYNSTPYNNAQNPLPLDAETLTNSGNWTFDLS